MKPFLLLSLAIGLSSCAAQIDQKMKTATLQSSEVAGHNRLSLGAGYMEAPIVVVTDNARLRPPDRTQSFIEQQGRIFLQGAGAPIEQIEIFLDPSAWLGLKYQFLGDSFQRAERGNLSASVVAAGWHEEDKGRGSNLSFRNRPGDNVSIAPDVRFEKKAVAWKVGTVAGYRVSAPILIYLGYFFQKHRYWGSFDIVGGSRGRFAGGASAQSLNLGVEIAFNKNFVLRLEDAYSIAKVPAYGAKSSQHSVGLLLSAHFGGEN